jgi:hypothetical protein
MTLTEETSMRVAGDDGLIIGVDTHLQQAFPTPIMMLLTGEPDTACEAVSTTHCANMTHQIGAPPEPSRRAGEG